MFSASAFVLVAVLLCGLVVMAIFPITDVYMSRVDAIERDGLARGVAAPVWQLPDVSGQLFRSPPSKPFQLVMFTDHSLKSFPSVIEGLRSLMAEETLEPVILLQGKNEIAAPVLSLLGLAEIPVLTGTRSLYGGYNVRVTPFAILVDREGRVRASSLVNHDWQLEKLWHLANLPLAPEESKRTGGLRLALGGTGGVRDD